MLCNNCGNDNLNGAKVCVSCDNNLSMTPTPPPLTAINIFKSARFSTSVQDSTLVGSSDADTLLAGFVGEKYDSYYRDKWFNNHIPTLSKDKTAFNVQSFNLAGFFLGMFWLCYRKMYLLAALIMFAITVIDLILMHVLGMDIYNIVGQSPFMFIWIVITGMYGNYLYLNHSVKRIEEITSSTSDPNIIREELTKKGGTSWVGAIGVSLLIIIASVVISYLFAPSWYWIE